MTWHGIPPLAGPVGRDVYLREKRHVCPRSLSSTREIVADTGYFSSGDPVDKGGAGPLVSLRIFAIVAAKRSCSYRIRYLHASSTAQV